MIVSLLRSITLMLALSFASGVQAASVSDLVAERAALDLGMEMPDLGRFEIIMAGVAPETGLTLREFWIDHDSGQFIANLITEQGTVQRISGLAVLTLPVPVTRRRLLPGDIVAEEDVEMIELPWQRVSTFAVLKREDLVGKQVRRMISQGRPVQLQSVIPPIIIERGEEVKIELRHGALRLVTTGKAIGDAYLGQEVRVVNTASNKIITAVASGDGLVEVRQ